jgi:hypothetical protein
MDQVSYINPLKQKREGVRKDSIRSKEKTFGGKREALYIWGKEEHLVRRYPGNAHSSFR